MDPSSTLEAVRKWSLSAQLEFVFRLWDEIVHSGECPEPTDELAAELDRRLAAHDADPSNVRTWEEVLERVRKSK